MTESNSDESTLMDVSSFQHRSARVWNKIVIRVDSRMTEAVAAYLAGLSSSGIEISSDNGLTVERKGGLVIEQLTAYVPADPDKPGKITDSIVSDLKQFFTSLTHIFPDCSPPDLTSDIIKEEDWGKVWKSFFSSFQITPKLTIKPSWEETEQQQRNTDEELFVIEMDPGLAFGTGHHESTRLALLLLEELFLDKKYRFSNVLDVGTGSGILAMGCALFGAEKILAIDHDPDAVETAKGNISRNRLNHIITVSGQGIASVKPGYNLIVANITHDSLAEMAQTITGLLAPDGYLILSGILKGEQENSICDIYTGNGMHFRKIITKDEWTALLFQKD